MLKKQLQSISISILGGKKTYGTVTLSSGQMERRSKIGRMSKLQWLQPHRREKMLCKTRRSNSVIIVPAANSARDQISRLVTLGDQSLSQSMRPCQVINFIDGTIRNTISYSKSTDINKTIKKIFKQEFAACCV